jgi:solute carrier family 25 aspartate/glutamate transporter 12/13
VKPRKIVVVSKNPPEVTFIKSFFLGIISAGVASTFVYPLDKIKTRIQNSGGTISSSLRSIWKNEGPIYLFRGLSPQIAMIGPINAAQLASNDLGHRFFRGNQKERDLTIFETTASAGFAGVVEISLINPQEAVKINMQMQGLNGIPSENPIKVVKHLGIRGLYKGVTACALRDMPFNVLYFTIYEFTKRWLTPVDDNIGPRGLLTAGVVSGSIAAGLVTPADTVKTRLQTVQFGYNGIKHCFLDTIKTYGVKVLFRGTLSRVLTIGPMFGIQMMIFEMLIRSV